MRRSHFEAFAPRCPVCRGAGRGATPLTVARVLRGAPDDGSSGGSIAEAILQCAHPDCRREYPVIDGAPVLIGAIRAWLGGHLGRLTARDDLSPEIESLLGDGAGPGSDFDNARRELSTYGWDHWADQDDEAPVGSGAPTGSIRPGSAVRLLDAMLGLAERSGVALEELPAGPALDLGCSVGRTTFELARRLGRPVLGIDLGVSMVRTARRVLERGVASYPVRRVGVVYDRREHRARSISDAVRSATDFWIADAADLPFEDGTIALAASLNVLDCVASPRGALAELARVLAPGGCALVTTPYDWTPGATPYEQWLGGHSQRGDTNGAAEPVLRALLSPGLTPDAHPAAIEGLEIVAEAEDLPWTLRLHDRSAVEYRVHGLVLRRA